MSDATTTAPAGDPPAPTAGTLLGNAAPPAGTAASPPAGTPPAVAPPAGTDARDWLPEAFRADPTFRDIANVEALAKSYKGAASLVGLDKGQVLRLPKDEAAPEWAEVYARLGRPEKPEGYQFPELPGQLVEGVEPAARQAFHEMGLSAKQAAGVMGLYGAQLQAAETAKLARAEQVEAAVAADLQREWGDAFADRLHAANRVISEVGGADLGRLMQETVMPDGTRMGNHPLLIKAFAALAERTAEPGGLKGGSAGQSAAAPTPQEAQAEILRLRGDTEFHAARAKPSHPDHARNVDIWRRLNEAAAAGTTWVA